MLFSLSFVRKVSPELLTVQERRDDATCELATEPIDVTKCEERNPVSDASDEESQCALVHHLHPLVGVIDLHCSHELSH